MEVHTPGSTTVWQLRSLSKSGGKDNGCGKGIGKKGKDNKKGKGGGKGKTGDDARGQQQNVATPGAKVKPSRPPRGKLPDDASKSEMKRSL